MGLIVNPCLPFTGHRNDKGYGMHRHEGRVHLAHRVAYAKHHGLPMSEVPPLLRHTCDNPACREPTHLLPGTHQDNSDDKLERGRQAKHDSHGAAKRSAADVAAMRARYKPRCPVNGQRAMAREYGMSQAAVSDIINGVNWR